MKWIKASERLPEVIDWPELHYRYKGYKVDSAILLGNEAAGIIWFQYKEGTRYINIEDVHEVEWLDESPTAPVEQEGQEEMWGDVFKLIYGGTPYNHTYPDNVTHLKSKYTITKK